MGSEIYQGLLLVTCIGFAVYGFLHNPLQVRDYLALIAVAVCLVLLDATAHVFGGYLGFVDERSYWDLLSQQNPAIRDPVVPLAYVGIGFSLGGLIRQLARG